jgi:hypothetical protein
LLKQAVLEYCKQTEQNYDIMTGDRVSLTDIVDELQNDYEYQVSNLLYVREQILALI